MSPSPVTLNRVGVREDSDSEGTLLGSSEEEESEEACQCHGCH